MKTDEIAAATKRALGNPSNIQDDLIMHLSVISSMSIRSFVRSKLDLPDGIVSCFRCLHCLSRARPIAHLMMEKAFLFTRTIKLTITRKLKCLVHKMFDPSQTTELKTTDHSQGKFKIYRPSTDRTNNVNTWKVRVAPNDACFF